MWVRGRGGGMLVFLGNGGWGVGMVGEFVCGLGVWVGVGYVWGGWGCVI